jgi:dGTPase
LSDPSAPQDARRKRLTTEPKPGDYREPAQRDYDRILYSSAFRRLGGVTQVVAAHEGHVFHNRLTHSLRVAQVARRLAQKFLKLQSNECRELGGIDPDVAEAAALAHDLGHPPFGHTGEEELRTCVEEHHIRDAFEGNAQSFRIVTKLALRSPDVPGLNLTRATLNAILKYPWPRQTKGFKSEKYGIYECEVKDFNFARELHPPGDDRKSPEAEIMDWADDVTYAVHDAEDFYRAGLIPLDRLGSLKDDAERQRFFDGMYARPELQKRMGTELRPELESAFYKVITSFPISEEYNSTQVQRSRLRDFSSNLIGQFVEAITLRVPKNDSEGFIEIRPLQKMQVKILKALTWFYVIYNPTFAIQQYGQKQMIRHLFHTFCDAAMSKKDHVRNIIPFAFRDVLTEKQEDSDFVVRTVTDLIAGMTEQGLIKIYRRLSGVEMGSILDQVHST